MISTLRCEGMETRSGPGWAMLASEKERSGHVMRGWVTGGTDDLFQCFPGEKISSSSLSAPHLSLSASVVNWTLFAAQFAQNGSGFTVLGRNGKLMDLDILNAR